MCLCRSGGRGCWWWCPWPPSSSWLSSLSGSRWNGIKDLKLIRNQQINLTIIDMNLDLPLFKCIAHCCLETDANGSAMSLLTTNFVVEVSVMWHLETVCWGSVIYFKWEVSRLSHSDCRYFNTFTSCDESHRACLLGRRESDTCGHDGTSFHSNNKTTYICIHQYHNMCCWYI